MKPVIIGMNNPYSKDPKYTLYPSPRQSAGHRLFEMVQRAGARSNVDVTMVEYADRFDRANLVVGKTWNASDARATAVALIPWLQDKEVVICGKAVALAFSLTRPDFSLTKKRQYSFNYWVIPHPSGMCREYNDPSNVRRVGDLLLDLYMRSN